MKWLFLVCFALPVLGYSQSVKVREIRRRPLARFFNTRDSTIVYPVFVTSNRRVDSAINAGVRTILESDGPGLSLLKAIQATIRGGLTDLSYEIRFSNRSFLSVTFSIEWCGGAYPTSWEKNLSFDLRTGEVLTVNDLFDHGQLEKVKSLVLTAKTKFLTAYKEEQLQSLRAGSLDSATYQSLMETVDSECINSVSVEDFSLTKTGIEFFDRCDMPHVIAGYTPEYSLVYSYPELAGYLKPEFTKKVAGP